MKGKTRPRQTDAKLEAILAEAREFQEFVALVNQVRARGYTDEEIKVMLLREVGPKPRAIEAAKRRAMFKLV